jgi:hypothetical protein
MAVVSELVATMVLVRIYLYVIGRLSRDRATRHLVPPLRTVIESLETAAAHTETAVRAVTDARSGVDAADADLDEQISAFESALLLSVGKNRKSPRYKKLFPKGLLGATRTDPADQVRQARRIEDGITRDLGDQPFATDALPRITAAREALELQQAALQQAKDNLADVRAAERTVRIEASAQYRMTYGDLVKLFPHNLRKVRGFFRHEKAVKETEDPAEPSPTTPPVPAAPTAPEPTSPPA